MRKSPQNDTAVAGSAASPVRRLVRRAPARPALSRARAHLRSQLELHVSELGYSAVHATSGTVDAPEIVRVSPTRGRLAYGETVLHGDLRRRQCHERLVAVSQRRTRRRSSILFFVGVSEDDRQELEALLERLEIRSGIRGGHVHVVAIAPESRRPLRRRRPAAIPLRA
jgi:hypothetical protein